MLIDCDTCAVRNLHCGDCVMTVLLSSPTSRMEIDPDEQAALSALADGGLLPPLRLVPVQRADAPAPSAPEAGPPQRRISGQNRRNVAG